MLLTALFTLLTWVWIWNVFRIHWHLNCSDISSHFLIVHPPSDLSREIKEHCTIGAGWIYNRRLHHTRKENCEIISHADISPQAIYFGSSADRTKNIIRSLLVFLNLLSSNLTSLSLCLILSANHGSTAWLVSFPFKLLFKIAPLVPSVGARLKMKDFITLSKSLIVKWFFRPQTLASVFCRMADQCICIELNCWKTSGSTHDCASGEHWTLNEPKELEFTW